MLLRYVDNRKQFGAKARTGVAENLRGGAGRLACLDLFKAVQAVWPACQSTTDRISILPAATNDTPGAVALTRIGSRPTFVSSVATVSRY